MSSTDPQAHMGDMTKPTIDSWRAYRQRGYRRVRYVGMFGDVIGVYGSIRRVTAANVYVLVDGAAQVEPFHPADLRPTNVFPAVAS